MALCSTSQQMKSVWVKNKPKVWIHPQHPVYLYNTACGGYQRFKIFHSYY